MGMFCSDVDVMRFEPRIFGDARFDHYLLASGEGAALTNGVLECIGENFTTSGIAPQMVVELADAAETRLLNFEVVEVLSDSQLKLSRIQAFDNDAIITPADESEMKYRIVSFEPVISEVYASLASYFGLRPVNPVSGYSIDSISDVAPLRQVCTYGVLAIVFERLNAATLASLEFSVADSQITQGKAILYRTLFEKSREACVFTVLNGDGGEKIFRGGSFKLSRG